MKSLLRSIGFFAALAGLAGSAAAAPTSALLDGLAGQACRGQTPSTVVLYGMRDQGGRWSVRIGKAGSKWYDASVDGATLTFKGAFTNQDMLTATGAHSAEARYQVGIHSYGPYALTCAPEAAR